MPSATFIAGVLTDDLVELADDVRAIYTELGARPFRTFVVRRTWVGPRAGEGAMTEVATEILPRPAVLVAGLRGDLRPAGLDEEGDIVVSEISLRWTEPELYSPTLTDVQRHMFRIDDAHGQGVRSRFYVPTRPPTPIRGDSDRPDVLSWSIELRRQET
jgi:hypothetical protein